MNQIWVTKKESVSFRQNGSNYVTKLKHMIKRFYKNEPDLCHKNKKCLILSKRFKLFDKIMKIQDKKI